MIDILLNESDNLLFENGDFVTGESTEQHQKHLLLFQKGDVKEDPTVGVGISSFMKDDDEGQLLGTIKEEYQRDGMKIKRIKMVSETLTIDAPYK